MKKVLLVTLWDYANFGNRLQAIALKNMIESDGYQVVCVPNVRSYPLKTNVKKIAKSVLAALHINRFAYVKLVNLRKKYLKESSDKLLAEFTPVVHNFHFPKGYDLTQTVAAVSGSDQVWHRWTQHENELDYYYLQFMPQEKRISYAASYGFEAYPQRDAEAHKRGVNGMHFISCREKTGCELVSSISDQKAELVLDPTLCVGRDFWEQLMERPHYDVPKHYLFCMMLGSPEGYSPYLERYAKEKNLEIVDIRSFSDPEMWKTTIGGFIWLIRHADLVCTDSFHCCVFSILFEKTFTVFKRQEKGFDHMYDRIATLLHATGLEQSEFDRERLNDQQMDFKVAKERIEPMVQSSRNWLKEALRSVDK